MTTQNRKPRTATQIKAERKAREEAVAAQKVRAKEQKVVKRQRPAPTFTGEKRAVFLNLLGNGFSVTKSCRYAGISIGTARKAYHGDEDFKRLWDEALETGCDRIDHEILSIGLEGKDDRIRLEALKFLARARKPEVYSEKQNVQIDDKRDAAPTKERLEDLRRLGVEAGNDPELDSAIEILAARFADHATQVDVSDAPETLPEDEEDPDAPFERREATEEEVDDGE